MERNTGILSRGAPAIAVIGLHVLVIYGLVVSMGIVELPKFAQPMEAVFIPQQTEIEPPPVLEVAPEMQNVVSVDEPAPVIEFEEPIAPPTDIPLPVSDNAIAATTTTETAPASTARELKTDRRVEPGYPPTSRRLGEEGTVHLKVLVDERGRPRDVQVANSSGSARLDKAAQDAVRKWRFIAATDGANAITAWTQVAITFRLTQ